MTCLLDASRAKLEVARRDFDAFRYRVSPPGWLNRNDPLYATYTDAPLLLREGDLVWGHVVQANGQLFSRGTENAPAAVLFAEDRTFDHLVDRLLRASQQLFALRSDTAVDSEFERMRAFLTNERERAWRVPCPAEIARGQRLFVATIMIHRWWLPLRYIGVNFLPILVSERVPTVMMLPGELWAEDLVKAWRDLADESA